MIPQDIGHHGGASVIDGTDKITRSDTAGPVMEAGDPNQLNGYDYAGNNPVTGSDPSGLMSDPSGPACGSSPSAHACWDPWGGGGSGGGGGDAGVDDDTAVSACPSKRACGEFPEKVQATKGRLAIIEGRKPFWTQVKDYLYVPALFLGVVDAKHCLVNGDVAGCAWTIIGLVPLLRPLRFLEAAVDAARVAEAADKAAQAAADAVKAAQAADDAAKATQAAADAAKAADTAADSSKAADGAGDSGKAAQDAPVACAGNSFAGGTQVLMADGTGKPIQDVKVGDQVANADPDSTASQQHAVSAIHVTDTDTDFTSLSVATAAGPKTITVTAHHLFWDSRRHSWTDAYDLKLGDQLDTSGDGSATVVSSWRFTSSLRTYNLTIDAVHTYYVFVGATPVLVHNSGCKEVVTDTFSSFEQARNKALTLLGDVDPATRIPLVGRLEKATSTCGKVVGFTTRVNGVFKQFRMDYDLVKGPHINVMVGKGDTAQEWAVPWEGLESDFINLLGGNS